MKRSIRIADDDSVVITGNRLTSGRIVWLGVGGNWTAHIKQSQQFRPENFMQALEAAREGAASCNIIDVYEVPVTPGDPPTPVSMREKIRAFGPTVHPQFASDPGP